MTASHLPVLLMPAALCAMVCDGKIHESELDELRLMVKHLPLFQEQGVDTALEEKILEAGKDPYRLFAELFAGLREAKLDAFEGLQVLEVILRTIHADNDVDPMEVQFVRTTIRVLGLPLELIVGRFGRLPFLEEATGLGEEFEADPISSEHVKRMVSNWGAVAAARKDSSIQ